MRHTSAIITQTKPNTTIAFDAKFISEHIRLNVCTKNGPKNIANEVKPIITNAFAPPRLFITSRNHFPNLLNSRCFIITSLHKLHQTNYYSHLFHYSSNGQ